MTDEDDARASFGFADVAAGEKARLVRGVFSSVAGRYDLMNDLMSAGVHRIWKSVFIDRLNPQPGERLLDVAGGTGDIAIGFLKRADARPQAASRPPASAVLCDINADMLAAGRGRAAAMTAGGRLAHVCGDAETLPFKDQSVDAYTIAFGIRNVPRIDAALAEAHRVLKPGGRILVLEFSQVVLPVLDKIYDAFSFNVIPLMGRAIAGDGEPYRYLVESIRKFPPQEKFAQMIRDAGFSRVDYTNYTGGIAALHSGWKI